MSDILFIILLGILNGIATSLLLFLTALFFSFSEPEIKSRLKRAGEFFSSRFMGYLVGSIISFVALLFFNIQELFLIALILWLFSIFLLLPLRPEVEKKVARINLTEMKEAFTAVSHLLLITFVLSMSLATVGGIVEPLIYSKINATAYFSLFFILANIAGVLVPLYFPKNRILLAFIVGSSLSVISEFLYPITLRLPLLLFYGTISQAGNSIVWPIFTGKIVAKSKYPVIESGALATLTDVSTMIADGFVVLTYPFVNIYALSVFSLISGIAWLGMLINQRKVVQ